MLCCALGPSVVEMQKSGLCNSGFPILQIPLRDCKKIEFVRKENNPFNE